MNKTQFASRAHARNEGEYMDDTIYLIPLIEAIALNHSAMTVVNKIYEQNKTEIYAVAVTHPYYNHPFFDHAGIDFAVACRRALGVYVYLEGNILPVIKRGWNGITKYVQGGGYAHDYFWAKYVTDPKLSDGTAVGNAAVAAYLLEKTANSMAADLLYEASTEYAEQLERWFTGERKVDSHIAAEDIAAAKQFLAAVERELGHKLDSTERVLQIYQPDSNIMSPKVAATVDMLIWEAEAEGVSISNINPPVLTRDDVLYVLSGYMQSIRISLPSKDAVQRVNVDTNDVFTYIIPALIIRLLSRSVGYTQAAYFRDSSETLLGHVAEMEAQIAEMRAKVAEAERQALAEAQSKREVQKQLASLITSAEAKDREIQLLQAQITENREELIALRDLAFSLREEEGAEDYASEPVIIPSNLRVLICGGRENWQRRLREELPSNFSFLSSSRNFDTDVLRNQEWVLFYTPSMSHAFYERVLTNRPEGVRIGYLSSQNIEKTLQEISRVLEGK